ncbi:tetratricopeptide repeat protein [Marinospirillum alkaliphilum]|uniref:Tetratricopeptide repeat-containing protein n=1 Tax=Marinospirillum alkaliphilum DSM 21637 TaxID=1122209 RepID=A0A1K1TVI9_9GAMM|nr:tetratricopeptide repeat protein [Marinospirillum alkaliphilum]SFX04727.1 Tetratricopeptide repeat-containing protein [Marinospirillum alkaliphilum DSM 21637]
MLVRNTLSAASGLSGRLLFCLVLLFSVQVQADAARALQQLNQEQQFQAAYELGLRQLAHEAGRPAFDMAFGVAALESGHYDQALFAFERVLMVNRNAPLPRLELARTHFMMGNLIAARRHFNQVLEQDPPPPPAVARRIQWFLNAIDQREAGRAVAASDMSARFHLGIRLGHDSNPRNMTHQDVLLFGALLLDLPEPESDTFHEVFGGVTFFQQRAESWGWFMGGDLSLRTYHDQSEMNATNFNLRGGPIFLGTHWRLVLPLQLGFQVRSDDNRTELKSLAAEYTRRIDAARDYTLFGQLAKVDHEPGGALRDVDTFTAGFIYSLRPMEQLRLYLGPVYGNENASDEGPHFGRSWYGLRSGAGYALNEQQRLDFNLSHIRARHKAEDPVFLERRTDNQTSYGVNFTHRAANNMQLELGLQQSGNDSNMNLYTYNRTQLTAGIRKEW